MNIVHRINEDLCGRILNDPERINYIDQASLIGSGSEEAFDRLTFLASKLLNVPLTIVSFVGDKSQYFKSAHGLPEPWNTDREIPIDVSVCQYTLVGDILSLKDVREHPLLAGNPAVPALNLVGYLGVPLMTESGHNLGAFCAISDEVREWSESDIEILKTLTKSIMSEIELKLTVQKLNQEKEDWEKTVSMLIHDLRGPLGTIIGWSDVGKSTQDKSLQAEAFGSISRCADQGIKIVDNILDWKLSDLNIEGELLSKKFEITHLLIPYLSDIQKIRNVEINHNLLDKEIEVSGHEDSITRAITNLVGNAIKYGDCNQPISVEVSESNDNLVVSVHNFGEPIEQSKIADIFKFSKRARPEDQYIKEGWGIGLYLVDSVVKAHGGFVNVTSSQDKGTEFKFSIPKINKKYS